MNNYNTDINTLHKLIILYILDKVKIPLTSMQINDFFLHIDPSLFFTVSNYLKELEDIKYILSSKKNDLDIYLLTEEGKSTIDLFSNQISRDIKEEINNYLKENKIKFKEEFNITSNLFKSTASDYILECKIKEGKSTSLSITINLPNSELGEKAKENWRKNYKNIYKLVITELLK